MSTGSVEVVYRGIFQKTLAKNICRGIVLAARKEGKIGIAFGRYGDSPERNGIPAKQFAVFSDNEEELEEHLAKYEPDNNDVTIAVDDALCKGVESWAWYGLQPINKLLADATFASSFHWSRIAASMESRLSMCGATLASAPNRRTSVWSSLYTHSPEKLAGDLTMARL